MYSKCLYNTNIEKFCTNVLIYPNKITTLADEKESYIDQKRRNESERNHRE